MTNSPRTTDGSRVVRRVLSGEREAFSVLVDRHKRGVTNFIGASVRSPSDVADVAQETFLRAYAHLGTFNPKLGRFSTWIYHIARNVVRTHLGKSLRQPPTQTLGEDQTLENALRDTSRESDPVGGVERSEDEREVRVALAELPERTRTVLALRYYDAMDYQTIAQTMGLSLGNVKTLIHRGKLALAQKLRDREARVRSRRNRSVDLQEEAVLCSSCERSLDDYVEQMLDEVTRKRIEAHLARCGSCRAFFDRLRVVDAILSDARASEPAPNFTLRTMIEVRSLPPPDVARLPLLRVGAAYLLFAWSLIATLFLLDRPHARALIDFLIKSGAHLRATSVALAHASGHLFGAATPAVALTVSLVLIFDGAIFAVLAVAVSMTRPRAARAGVGRS